MASYQDHSSAPKRPDKIRRYKPSKLDTISTNIYLWVIIWSICCLAMKSKWCGWCAIFCSCMYMGNSNVPSDIINILICFIISTYTIGITYRDDPSPMGTPW